LFYITFVIQAFCYRLNYLVVSGDAGLLNIYVYGLLLIASIDKDTGRLQVSLLSIGQKF